MIFIHWKGHDFTWASKWYFEIIAKFKIHMLFEIL